jgi:hypothetical protein
MLQARSSAVKNFIMVSVLAWVQSISGRTDTKGKVVLWDLDKIKLGMAPTVGWLLMVGGLSARMIGVYIPYSTPSVILKHFDSPCGRRTDAYPRKVRWSTRTRSMYNGCCHWSLESKMLAWDPIDP